MDPLFDHGPSHVSTAPAILGVPFVKHDTNDVSTQVGFQPRAVYIGTGGTISILTTDTDAAAADVTVYDGQTLDWAFIRRIRSTGTTGAAGFWALK